MKDNTTEQSFKDECHAILKHTVNGAVNKRYCGGSKEMSFLCEQGLMRSLGRVKYVPDEYFTITEEGERYLNDN